MPPTVNSTIRAHKAAATLLSRTEKRFQTSLNKLLADPQTQIHAKKLRDRFQRAQLAVKSTHRAIQEFELNLSTPRTYTGIDTSARITSSKRFSAERESSLFVRLEQKQKELEEAETELKSFVRNPKKVAESVQDSPFQGALTKGGNSRGRTVRSTASASQANETAKKDSSSKPPSLEVDQDANALEPEWMQKRKKPAVKHTYGKSRTTIAQ